MTISRRPAPGMLRGSVNVPGCQVTLRQGKATIQQG